MNNLLSLKPGTEQAIHTIAYEVKAEIKQELHADKLATKADLEIVKLKLQKEITEASTKIIIWVAGILGSISYAFSLF